MTYTLPSLAFIAIISAAEAVVLRRQFEYHVTPIHTDQLFLFILFFNLAFWVVYRSVVYPTFFSRFRHLPTAKVNA